MLCGHIVMARPFVRASCCSFPSPLLDQSTAEVCMWYVVRAELCWPGLLPLMRSVRFGNACMVEPVGHTCTRASSPHASPYQRVSGAAVATCTRCHGRLPCNRISTVFIRGHADQFTNVRRRRSSCPPCIHAHTLTHSHTPTHGATSFSVTTQARLEA
jgi:hypothetical protein